jgi:hypothetical protein
VRALVAIGLVVLGLLIVTFPFLIPLASRWPSAPHAYKGDGEADVRAALGPLVDEHCPLVSGILAEQAVVDQAGVVLCDVPARGARCSVEDFEKWSASSLRRHPNVGPTGQIDEEADGVRDGIERCDAKLFGIWLWTEVDWDFSDGAFAILPSRLDFSTHLVMTRDRSAVNPEPLLQMLKGTDRSTLDA